MGNAQIDFESRKLHIPSGLDAASDACATAIRSKTIARSSRNGRVVYLVLGRLPDNSASASLLFLTVLSSALVLAVCAAHATWKPEYANYPLEVQEWYRNAELTEAAQRRFKFKSCCAHSDVVKTSFRVYKGTGGDEWYWLKDGEWVQIPSDVIHWGESAPDRQPTLFAVAGSPTCFYPGEGGL